ncbi:MAG: universal stress protein [Candidatus Acidiferrales bacterium]
MKILLAVDDSKYSEAATQAVVRQMRPEGAEVCVFHVVVPPVIIPYAYVGQVETLEAAQRERLKEGKELGERTAQQLRSAGFQVHTVIEEGEPKTAILDRAVQWDADLIFMGSHGRKGIDRFLIGSTSQAVLRHALCSVEIVRIPSVKAT